ncbi:chromate efflux transporter [Thalassovita sp.]|uniref:chromate efflux transporter n=1 Tax=Thalassovita sp. TaxID=1979401 RepID=UPI0029DE8BC0|nr:chromate efflux transporter [Thalassovita sp.]
MTDATIEPVAEAELFRVFLRIGLLSFGGPAAQIALMHRVLVEEKRWLSERDYLNALSFCMMLPGPEAMQIATYAGWRLRGIPGGLVAGLLFVLPGAVIIFALATLYAAFGAVPLVATLFQGVQAAALVIVLEALLRVSRKALAHRGHWGIAGLSFVALFLLAVPFPLVVLAAGAYGALFGVRAAETQPSVARVSGAGTLRVVVIGLVIWALPVAVLALLSGLPILGQLGVFFSKLAVVTFGGAYAVLAYMAQDVVTGFGWLTATEMMDALGLAETTPGPLILVTQFVGYLAAYREGGYGLAMVGGLVVLWVTFVPCFLWIFAGAPYIGWISAQPRLNAALRAITAAVVGVILNLSIWFGLHVLFDEVTRNMAGPVAVWLPDWATLDWRALVLAVGSGVLLLRLHMGLGWVLGIAAGAAVLLGLIG